MLPLTIAVHLQVTALLLTDRLAPAGASLRREEGQTTAEYALVLLGAAAIALLLGAWAKRTGKLGELLDAVLDDVTDRVG